MVPEPREHTKLRRGGDFDDNNSLASSGSARSSFSRTSTYSRSSAVPSQPRRVRPVSMVPEDPNLPPAFRAANRAMRKKNSDDFYSLGSVHSRSFRTGNCSTAAGSLASDDSSLSSGSFDDEDSFASIDSDADEDDEAYRESRNQMARLNIEKQNQSRDSRRGGKSRFKKKAMGVNGTTLDFIAE